MFNGLDAEFRPAGGGEPCPPPFPWRSKAFIYACGVVAAEERIEMAEAIVGGGATRGTM